MVIALSGFSSAAGVDSKSRQSALRKARVVVGLGKVHLVMSGYVFHVVALGEQITNIAKICIIGNLRNSLLIYSHPF
jgi:hypothetical protein